MQCTREVCSLARAVTALFALFAGSVIAATPVYAQPTQLAGVDTVIVAPRAAAGDDSVDTAASHPARIEASDVLRRAYTAREWAPFWLQDGRITPPARAMLAALTRVGERGLDPDDYTDPLLATLGTESDLSAARRLDVDAALSDIVLRLVHDLRSGRVSPGDAHASLSLPSDTTDLAATLAALAGSMAPEALLDAQEPPYAAYRHLKLALARYREFAIADSTYRPRVAQIALAMERWRWVPRTFSAPPVIVNVASFTLSAWRRVQDDSGALVMDVVVGDALRHRTPIFADSLQYVVFAPYWNVPASIALAELVPIGLRDPHLLTVNNYEVVAARGRVLPATRASVRAVQAGRAYMRQLPGGTNSLGRVKFMFPNAFDVYLHDTPVQTEFNRTRRDLSHGCIRVADPVALALHLLRAANGWDSTAVVRAMNGAQPTRVDLPRAVPLLLLYATAEARPDGTVTFHDDVYQQDAVLAALSPRVGRDPGVEAAHNRSPR